MAIKPFAAVAAAVAAVNVCLVVIQPKVRGKNNEERKRKDKLRNFRQIVCFHSVTHKVANKSFCSKLLFLLFLLLLNAS